MPPLIAFILIKKRRPHECELTFGAEAYSTRRHPRKLSIRAVAKVAPGESVGERARARERERERTGERAARTLADDLAELEVVPADLNGLVRDRRLFHRLPEACQLRSEVVPGDLTTCGHRVVRGVGICTPQSAAGRSDEHVFGCLAVVFW